MWQDPYTQERIWLSIQDLYKINPVYVVEMSRERTHNRHPELRSYGLLITSGEREPIFFIAVAPVRGAVLQRSSIGMDGLLEKNRVRGRWVMRYSGYQRCLGRRWMNRSKIQSMQVSKINN